MYLLSFSSVTQQRRLIDPQGPMATRKNHKLLWSFTLSLASSHSLSPSPRCYVCPGCLCLSQPPSDFSQNFGSWGRVASFGSAACSFCPSSLPLIRPSLVCHPLFHQFCTVFPPLARPSSVNQPPISSRSPSFARSTPLFLPLCL